MKTSECREYFQIPQSYDALAFLQDVQVPQNNLPSTSNNIIIQRTSPKFL